MFARESPFRGRALSIFVAIPIVAVFATLGFVVALRAGLAMRLGVPEWLVAIAAALFVSSIIAHREAKWWRDNGRWLLMRRCRCASCAFTLDGLEADRFGSTICPECGAAWKLPRVRTPH